MIPTRSLTGVITLTLVACAVRAPEPESSAPAIQGSAEIEIQPIEDLADSLQRAKQLFEAMGGG